MKIVINKRFGGFGLSHEGMLRYAELKGLTLYPEGDGVFVTYWTVPPRSRGDVKRALFHGDIPRDDPALVQVVEELGDKANDDISKLAVVEIPDGVEWEIDEYDGLERVAEAHRTWS